jgi:ferredoxin
MKIKSVKLVYYSPTGTSKKIVESIVRGLAIQRVKRLNLIDPTPSNEKPQKSEELMVIGAPVYGGRLPIQFIDRLNLIKGNNTPAVATVIYGNRDYDDALLELTDLVKERGYRPIAGGAFIGEHSYSTEKKPIAQGRPDSWDIKKAILFGNKIRRKLEKIDKIEDLTPIDVPGDYPYKERGKRSNDIAPVTDEDGCVKCGECVKVCPVGAITVEDTVNTYSNMCTRCSACIKVCPVDARVWKNSKIREITDWLYINYNSRKEPETFI